MSHLHYAARRGLVEEVRAALNEGVGLEEKLAVSLETALHIAADKGLVEIVELLLAAGADPNATRNNGATPLHEAAGGGHLEIVEMLIAAGAEIEPASRKATPALYAAMHNHREVANVLLELGSSPDAKWGHTVTEWLEIGGMRGEIEAMGALRVRGALGKVP